VFGARGHMLLHSYIHIQQNPHVQLTHYTTIASLSLISLSLTTPLKSRPAGIYLMARISSSLRLPRDQMNRLLHGFVRNPRPPSYQAGACAIQQRDFRHMDFRSAWPSTSTTPDTIGQQHTDWRCPLHPHICRWCRHWHHDQCIYLQAEVSLKV
jgi:hypothetical protein